jgi:hypothetical protein
MTPLQHAHIEAADALLRTHRILKEARAQVAKADRDFQNALREWEAVRKKGEE